MDSTERIARYERFVSVARDVAANGLAAAGATGNCELIRRYSEIVADMYRLLQEAREESEGTNV